jgi:hypothetical protein
VVGCFRLRAQGAGSARPRAIRFQSCLVVFFGRISVSCQGDGRELSWPPAVGLIQHFQWEGPMNLTGSEKGICYGNDAFPAPYEEATANRLCSTGGSFFGVSNLAQTISESCRTLPKWAQLKYAKKGQKKLTREQSSPSIRASGRLGLGLLPHGRSLPKLAITPSTV